jgi:hypothetical protein
MGATATLQVLKMDFTCTHFQTGRFLEPVKAIQVRLFKPKTFVIGQSDGDGVFMGGDEFERPYSFGRSSS